MLHYVSRRKTYKIRWIVRMYQKQKDIRCKYCANPQFNGTPLMHE